jgi:hypothetical protein
VSGAKRVIKGMGIRFRFMVRLPRIVPGARNSWSSEQARMISYLSNLINELCLVI